MSKNKPKYIIVHCTATPEGRDVTAADVDRWHRNRGFAKIGYHYIIRLDGTIEKGRDEKEAGAHCLGKNTCSIGVCYVGGVDKQCRPRDTRTASQKAALTALLTELKRRYPEAEIHGHRDFAAKACPSFDATGEYKTLGIATAIILGTCATSCRSQKSATATDDTLTAIKTDFETSTTLATFVRDSIEVEIIAPTATLALSDSSRVAVGADKIIVRRRTCTEQREKRDATTTGTSTTLNHTETAVEMSSERAVLPPAADMIFGLGASIAVILTLKYLYSKWKRHHFSNR